MRRWLASLLVLSACAGGGQSAPAVTTPATTDTVDRPSTDAVVSEPSATTSATSTTLVDPDLVVPVGFDLVAARVTAADGTTCDLCLWLADTGALRGRGLMSVTGLAPAEGMAFVYPEPRTTRFWMKDTLPPLSIAFYAVDGAFIDSFDMDPCVSEDSADCVRYPTPADFVVAVETYQGGLEALGMMTGSTLELLDLACRP